MFRPHGAINILQSRWVCVKLRLLMVAYIDCIMFENSECILRKASSRLSSRIHCSVAQDLVSLSLLR